MSNLTILCISRFDQHAEPFIRYQQQLATELDARFVLGADGPAPDWVTADTIVHFQSKGYVESVLDQAVDACPEGHILRLDDDETVSTEMREWLCAGEWRASDHWAFPRMNLWPDASSFIASPPLWPDLQTRLSVKAKSGSRPTVHQGSPFGTGTIAPVTLIHHKFLVRGREERERLVEEYEQVQDGAGTGWLPFSVPERYEFDLAPVA